MKIVVKQFNSWNDFKFLPLICKIGWKELNKLNTNGMTIKNRK